jgi:predicted ester cyclase
MDAQEFDKLGELLTSDFQLHLGSDHLDAAQTQDLIRMFYNAFPDFKHHVEQVLAVDEMVVLRATDRATHSGDFQGIAPTGRRVSFGQIGIYRMADGKIAEVWEEADIMGLMQQLGAV